MELAHLDLGILYANAGRGGDALRELNVAAKRSPNDVNPHWRLARLYQAMGIKEEANAEFQKTSSLTKAADDSVFTKLDGARTRSKPRRRVHRINNCDAAAGRWDGTRSTAVGRVI